MPVTATTPPHPLEGEIHVILSANAAGRLRIRSTRPLLAQRLLYTADRNLGLIYTLRDNAQVCRAACATAWG